MSNYTKEVKYSVAIPKERVIEFIKDYFIEAGIFLNLPDNPSVRMGPGVSGFSPDLHVTWHDKDN